MEVYYLQIFSDFKNFFTIHDSNFESKQKFIQILNKTLLETEYDPNSIEISIAKLLRYSTNQLSTKEVQLYLKKIEYYQIWFMDSNYVYMTPGNFENLINYTILIIDENVDYKHQSIYSFNSLVEELKESYLNAPEGYQMTMVHLFGIKNAEKLKSIPLKDISIKATQKESLYVEISKGIKLSKFVQIIEKKDDKYVNTKILHSPVKQGNPKPLTDLLSDFEEFCLDGTISGKSNSYRLAMKYLFEYLNINELSDELLVKLNFVERSLKDIHSFHYKELLKELQQKNRTSYLTSGFIKAALSKFKVFIKDKV